MPICCKLKEMLKVFLISFATILLLSVFVFYFGFYKNLNSSKSSSLPKIQTSNQPQVVQDRAAFAIYINGTEKKLNSDKFFHKSPDAYLSSREVNIINLVNPEVTWGLFFKTLPISISNLCLNAQDEGEHCTGEKGRLRFLLNGTEEKNFLNKKILYGDRALITFGNETQEEIDKQMSQVPNPLP